ncbi:MAG: glycosyltransferase, partial [Planctomycetota bacterium]
MTRPKIAITVLSYQSADHIAECVESVLAQTASGLALSVVDNASTDGSAEIVGERCPRVRIMRNRTNLGFAKAHNRMIAQTRADYYMPLNADCRLAPEFVERLLRTTEEEGAAYGTGKLLFSSTHPPYRIYSTGHMLLRDGTVCNRGYGEEDRGAYDRRETVWGANGAAPIYSMRMLRELS